MKVSDIGEFGLIDILEKMTVTARSEETGAAQNLILGIGDDATAWHGSPAVQLATTDCLIEDVHFTLEIISWEELGWRAMAANLSDIAAMGGLPRYALISLALPGITEIDSVTALYRGMLKLAQQFDVAIVGGDTSSAPLLIINITVLGDTMGRNAPILTRSAARPGDRIAVTGYLGTSAAGLEMLTTNMELEPETATSLARAFRQPNPRINEGQVLVDHGVKAAIDISDGLLADLGHVCRQSHVGATIDTDRLPILPEVVASFGDRAQELALSGGEDYELLFTATPRIIDRVKASATCPVTVIGNITADQSGKITLVDDDGNPVAAPRSGWQHFK